MSASQRAVGTSTVSKLGLTPSWKRESAVGPSARESTAATMHRQPTPRLIADAKAPLGEISQAKGSGGPYEAGS